MSISSGERENLGFQEIERSLYKEHVKPILDIFFACFLVILFLPEVKCFKAFDFFYFEILLTISTT